MRRDDFSASDSLKCVTSAGLGLDGRMYRMMRQVEEERLLPGMIDDLDRLVGQPVGEIFAVLAIFQVRHVAKRPENCPL